MILGLSLAGFTVLHLVISMIAIAFGFVVAGGLLSSNKLPGWTALFLITTILTNATGFLFPFTKLLPSHMVAIISLVLLLIAVYALYGKGLVGKWRLVYVVTSMLALWFNVFVLIAQFVSKSRAVERLRTDRNRTAIRDHTGCHAGFLRYRDRRCGEKVQALAGRPRLIRTRSIHHPRVASDALRFVSVERTNHANN